MMLNVSKTSLKSDHRAQIKVQVQTVLNVNTGLSQGLKSTHTLQVQIREKVTRRNCASVWLGVTDHKNKQHAADHVIMNSMCCSSKWRALLYAHQRCTCRTRLPLLYLSMKVAGVFDQALQQRLRQNIPTPAQGKYWCCCVANYTELLALTAAASATMDTAHRGSYTITLLVVYVTV
eukprot:17086-Heterococcus_DN1.PRE.2